MKLVSKYNLFYNIYGVYDINRVDDIRSLRNIDESAYSDVCRTSDILDGSAFFYFVHAITNL